MLSALRLAGYDKVLSVEREDSLMTLDEGLSHAARFLRESMMCAPKPTSIAWVDNDPNA